MSIESQLMKIKQVATLAMEGKTDEEISKETELRISAVPTIRNLLGFSRRPHIDIMKEYKLARVSDGTIGFQFTLPREYVEDIGLNVKSITAMKPHKYKGDIVKGKIVLTIMEGEK